MIKLNKKRGIGALSLLLFIIGVLLSFSFSNQPAYGDRILESVGLKAWSNVDTGIHYTIFYSLIFFISSLFLAFKHKKNIGAQIGGSLSLIIIILLVIAMFFISF